MKMKELEAGSPEFFKPPDPGTQNL